MKKTQYGIVPALLAVMLAGCAETPTPNLDQHFGEAVRTAIAQQTLNPDASRNTDPVAGLDGKAADQTINNYDKSFSKPEKGVTLGISVEQSGGGSSQ